MENLVNLEQLDYRDQLIKDYIDEHSGGGGGTSDYIPAQLALSKLRSDISPSGEDEQRLYIGIPAGTDISDLSLKFMRSCKVKQRNKREHIEGTHNKWQGLHQVWKIPVKSKIPLILLDFLTETGDPDYTKEGFDYYEIAGVWDGDKYNMKDFVNEEFTDDYQYVSNIMRHKGGGVVIVKDNKIVSSHMKFHSVYNQNDDDWRISIH